MHINICMSQPLQTCDVQPRSCILGKCECSLHSKAIFSHSPGTMNIHSRFHGVASCRILLFFWDTVLDRWMDHLGWFLGVLLFSLFIYGQSVWRRSLLQISLRTFLMSHWHKSSDLAPDIDTRPADRACMLVKLYWTWQLVNILQGDFRSLSGPYWP